MGNLEVNDALLDSIVEVMWFVKIEDVDMFVQVRRLIWVYLSMNAGIRANICMDQTRRFANSDVKMS